MKTRRVYVRCPRVRKYLPRDECKGCPYHLADKDSSTVVGCAYKRYRPDPKTVDKMRTARYL